MQCCFNCYTYRTPPPTPTNIKIHAMKKNLQLPLRSGSGTHRYIFTRRTLCQPLPNRHYCVLLHALYIFVCVFKALYNACDALPQRIIDFSSLLLYCFVGDFLRSEEKCMRTCCLAVSAPIEY